MLKLEDIVEDISISGLETGSPVRVSGARPVGPDCVKIVYQKPDGAYADRLLYRSDEINLERVSDARGWSFTHDGDILRLVSEAMRIRLAYLFDPYVAVYASEIEPLPHQITAVYGEMLTRQPLRFLLADDPGSGKTIMSGLLIKEMMIRADLERCLIVAPGSLVEQWQDELCDRFGLHFDLLSRDMLEAASAGNPFNKKDLLIARMDMLARDDDLIVKLQSARDWDLIVCDEAHRMSASSFGNEIKYTLRHRLGQKLGQLCRHFLLMTATPHNGRDVDFQLFMSLLDADRFEGKFRDSVHKVDTSDMMRRLTKEELLKFDGTKLFPERRATTVKYQMSDPEKALYGAVTEYVRNEMNRAERFAEHGQQRVNVGFALQILQRRLASSPAAIHESLKRRRNKLQERLEEERLIKAGQQVRPVWEQELSEVNYEDADEFAEAMAEEVDADEDILITRASAARNIPELEAEIETLERLERQAKALRHSGVDAKWQQLNTILDAPQMQDKAGNQRKLIIFTEPKDTLAYLADRIRTRLGRDTAVVTIHGGVSRENRRQTVSAFMNDPEVTVLVANDAAGEGVNLQRAHLMVNYDLPWNPNRIEQRFGRIHRIGQQDVCHLWNLVAEGTREGLVYSRLLEKLDNISAALGDRVFDVLGQLFMDRPLRKLLIEAIRYGDDPATRARLFEVIDTTIDPDNIRRIFDEDVLARDSMDASRVDAVRSRMELAAARRLQPHYIESFFLEGFKRLDGKIHRREGRRYEITRVPPLMMERDRLIGQGAPVQKRYERVCFDKSGTRARPRAEFIAPGHPLLETVISLILETYRHALNTGAVLVDDRDGSGPAAPRVLAYVESALRDDTERRDGKPNIVSQQFVFVEIDAQGHVSATGDAPYLDYRSPTPAEKAVIPQIRDADWLKSGLDSTVMDYAASRLVPEHLARVRSDRVRQVGKIRRQVEQRLSAEINFWEARANDLRTQERAGKTQRLNAENAESRVQELTDRMELRLARLDREERVSALAPEISGAALVIPASLIQGTHQPDAVTVTPELQEARDRIEQAAMTAVIAQEKAWGHTPEDVSATTGIGYDIHSVDGNNGDRRFIEVKGRHHAAETVSVTRRELMTAKNTGETFFLAIVRVRDGFASRPLYIPGPVFADHEPNFAEASTAFRIDKLVPYALKPDTETL